MKKLTAILLVLALGLLAGCAPTQVHVCPESLETQSAAAVETPAETEAAEAPADEQSLKTGLAVIASLGDSTSASAEEEGAAKYDVTLVAVTVDGTGVIRSCAIDGVKGEVKFGTDGVITTDLSAAPVSKYELGEAYGMKAYGGAKYEWFEQAQALADYAVGKTAEELKNGAINESGKAKDADLASVATIYLGGYVDGILKAVENAQDLGARSGDRLVLTTLNNLSKSANAEADKEGTAQVDVNIAVLTLDGDTITSCILDGLQAAVKFGTDGQITSDIAAAPVTKNTLGEGYGMKAYAGSTYEWNEQAASFAAYVTGKTAAQVAGIAVGERAEPADADLAATVTISVGDFMGLIAKGAGK